MNRFATALAVCMAVGMMSDAAFAQQIDPNVGAQAEMVKQRAKRVANDAGGAPAAPAAPAAPPTPSPPSGPRQMNPAQQQLVDKVQSDLFGIRADAPVTPAQKQALETDLQTLIKTAAKPSKDAVAKLAADLSAALSGKNVSVKDHAQLAKSMNVVMNCANLPSAQALSFVSSAEKVLQTGGVADDRVTIVALDLKAIISEVQKSKTQ